MSIRSFITNNFWTKLFSLVAAIIIWSTIKVTIAKRSDEVVSRQFDNLPLNILTASEDPRGFRTLPATVSVAVSGDSKIVDRLTDADIGVFVNVNESVDTQSRLYRVRVDVPPGLTVIQVIPPTVRMERAGPMTR